MMNVSVDVLQWWRARLDDGQIMTPEYGWAVRPEGDPWPPIVGTISLHQSMVKVLTTAGARYAPNSTEFFIQLRALLPAVSLIKGRRIFSGIAQPAILNFPALEECRSAFVEFSCGWRSGR